EARAELCVRLQVAVGLAVPTQADLRSQASGGSETAAGKRGQRIPTRRGVETASRLTAGIAGKRKIRRVCDFAQIAVLGIEPAYLESEPMHESRREVLVLQTRAEDLVGARIVHGTKLSPRIIQSSVTIIVDVGERSDEPAVRVPRPVVIDLSPVVVVAVDRACFLVRRACERGNPVDGGQHVD